MPGPEAYIEVSRGKRHSVVVLIDTVDRRIVPALRLVSRLRNTDAHALHISIDPEKSRQLANDWMDLGLTWLPLHVQDQSSGSLISSIRDALQARAVENGSVTVVIPALELQHWWQALLHRRSARRITRKLQDIPGVETVLVPFTTV